MRTTIIRYVFVSLFVLVFSVKASAKTFEVLNYNSLVYQGEVLIVRISDDLKDKNLQLFAFDELHVFNNNGFVFVGIDVNQEPKRDILYLVETSEEKHLQYDFFYTYVEVLKKDFGMPWYVGPAGRPDKITQERRQKEELIKDNAYSVSNIEADYTDGPFINPLEKVEETDSFGTLRFYGTRNNKTKKIKIERKVPHGGVDLRARTPLPVMAINSGKVLLTHNFPLCGTEGNMLIIDHGSGILSLYLHLSRFRVKVGDMVARGQVIASTGATPRCPPRKPTPPHLHFMIKVNGVNVDPLGFIQIFNQYLNQ